MGSKGSANRQRIVDAADRLFYSRGYNQTSFSDISDETGIPRGNFYYYFKTKEDILSAVVESRVSLFSGLLEQCQNSSSDPKQRLMAMLNLPLQREQELIQYGCPIGTLSSELCKDQDQNIADEKMTAVFDVMRDWCTSQFAGLGFEASAQDYAMDILARMQGVVLIASVYNDRTFLHRGMRDAMDWLDQLVKT